ncbi:MAG TPA: glycosyltransferase [Candidatus Brachybacterium merdavium]|uniref:Glycosyltransferase n=1 Tax=Candidatus Brachybacterium merdavium TaxID=2838513 RepID=A0A9D2LFB0_9MICO|nr:glycosyltransferase [Candidatus Brachybacterium merdavium]
MSVLVVRPRASGGLAAHVDQELEALAADGIAVHEADVQIQDRPSPLVDLTTVRTLRRLLASACPRAVHAHGLRAGALSALALPRRAPVRLVVTLHNRTVGGPAVRAVGAVLLRILARRAETVLAVSPDLAEDARHAGAKHVQHAIIPAPHGTGGPAARVTAPPSKASAAGDTFDILVIARLAPQKGLESLLDAAALLAVEQPPLRILVAGDGPLLGRLRARIDAEDLPVQLLGHREDVGELLAGADLVVSAARWEGQPVSLQEALRAGRAIVATDAGGTRWVTGEAARLVPVGDAQALAAAITDHVDDEVRAAAEQASRQRAAQLPGRREMTAQLREVLLGPPPPMVG